MTRLTGINEDGSVKEVGLQKDRLKVRSINTDEIEAAVASGLGFQSYTTELTLTTDVKQMIFQLVNQEDGDIFITSATVGTGVSTGGSDNSILIEQVGNVTAADPIVASGAAALITTRNAGNARTFAGSATKGPQAISGNEVATNGTRGDFTGSRTFDLTAQLPKGGRIGVAITPPAGNTSMVITLVVAFHVVNGT